MQLSIIAAILTAAAGVFFALQNNVPVTVDFMFWRFDGSLAMALLLAVALGAVTVALLTTPATLRRQWRSGRQKRRIEELERDCEALRGRVAELERAAGAPPPAPRPYVGLKDIVLSRGDAEGPDGPER
jgi:putative membrane protein